MPLRTGLLSSLDTVAEWLGFLDRPLSADALVAAATRRAGHGDFGDMSFVDPLRRFLAACDAEAELSVIGRIATQWDIGRFLSNQLRLRAEEARAPAILEQPVTRPIFIAGLPRSGTTFLHRLMLQDPANRGPLVYETIYPYPEGSDARRNTGESVRDDRVARVDRQLRSFEWLAPEFRALHPLEADMPQECSEIAAHVFRSLRFDSNYHVPSYREWLDAAGHVDAYVFHKRFLQHLQYQGRHKGTQGADTRWVLKCPDHVFALDAIRAVYPDARMVFVHRDPQKVLLSVTRLTEVLRAPFTRRIDRAAIGRQEVKRYGEAVSLMEEASRREDFAEPILHIRHTDLIADPAGTVAGVYQHFGLPWAPEMAADIGSYTAERPNGGYAPHSYRSEDYRLDPTPERERFAAYMARFGIEDEAAASRPRRELLTA
jgi:hypothetical protein